MHQLLTIDDLTKEDVEQIFSRVPAMQCGFFNHSGEPMAPNCDKIMATLFFEPSTRTKMSFQAAMYRLGGRVIDLPVESSQKKGETELDTIKTVAQYADVIVVRYPAEVMKSFAAACPWTAFINAGEASLHHPTQALLDLYTIRVHNPTKKELTILFTGDLYYSRTVPALVELLKKEDYPVRFLFTNAVHPSLINNDDPRYNYADERLIPDSLKMADVLYMTRPQKERWAATNRGENLGYSDFTLTKDLARTMKPTSIIMHPLPRNYEIHPDVDGLPQAKYFEQVRNGLHVRMALLHYMIWK